MTTPIFSLNGTCDKELSLCERRPPSPVRLESLAEVHSPERRPSLSRQDSMSESPPPLSFLFPSRTAFYLSLVFLVVATVTNASVHEVLNMPPSTPKLGPAAISSLTEALSPILPFTGGSDLRRVGESSLWQLLPTGSFDSWEAFYDGAQIMSLKMRNIPRGGASETTSSMTIADRIAIRKKYESAQTLLGSSFVFLPIETIGAMTLHDISNLFVYTVGKHREGFEEKKFLTSLSPTMMLVVKQIDETVKKARGRDVMPAKTTREDTKDKRQNAISSAGYGDVDALQFAAAMRIFAEWRVLRQVPEGYKGYAVGMGLGLKDVVQNVAKIEAAVAGFMEEERQAQQYTNDTKSDTEMRTPTLRDLLLSEVSLSLHKLPRLKEKSAAMGLLWVRRQLHYQTVIFANIYSRSYDTVHLGVAAAYSEVYDLYHGWAVQKIFNYSFKAAPPADLIYKTMNPGHYKEVLRKVETMGIDLSEGGAENNDEPAHEAVHGHNHDNTNFILKIGGHIGKEWDNLGRHVQVEWDKFTDDVQNAVKDTERLTKHILANEWQPVGHHIQLEWDKFGHHVHGEWDKLAGGVVKLFRHNNRNRAAAKNVRGGDLQGEAREAYLNNEMSRMAFEQFKTYLDVAQPLLDDLSGLFEEMNMDDPTKV